MGTEWNKVVFLPQLCFKFFLQWSYLMLSLSPHKEYGCRVDQEKTCSILVNSSQQERPEMRAHVCWWHCLPDTQEIITNFSKSKKAFGLKINHKKTSGSTVANNNRWDAEEDTWVLNASKAFNGMRKWIWLSKNPSIKTKYAVYHAVVLSTLLRVTETWMVYKVDAQRLDIYMVCQVLAMYPK